MHEGSFVAMHACNVFVTVRPPNKHTLFVEHAKHVSASQAVPQRRAPARPQSSVALGLTSANYFHATYVLTHLSDRCDDGGPRSTTSRSALRFHACIVPG